MTASLIRSDHTASLFDGEIVEENYLLAPKDRRRSGGSVHRPLRVGVVGGI
jgi:hypothetical protein